MPIQFDPVNLLAPMVGEEHGLAPAEIESRNEAAHEALTAFHRRVTSGEIGFPHLPYHSKEHAKYLRYAAGVRGSYDTVCVVGIGGSALGAWAVDCALRGPHPVQAAFSTRNPRLVVLDNVDPDFILPALESMNPKRTLVAVIAKSGATAETVATFLIVREWLEKALGAKAKDRIVAVTSPQPQDPAKASDLRKLAAAGRYEIFDLPGNVGGRFSVLSAVGLVPAALCGFDIRALCRGAAAMTNQCWNKDRASNPALNAALHHWLIWTLRNKPIQVAFPYANRLWGAAFWFRQLWAESLGKKVNRAGAAVHTGQTPVAALGTTDQHSQVQLYMEGPNDKVFAFWTVGKPARQGRIPRARTGLDAMDYLGNQTLAKLLDAEQRATAAALTLAARPNSEFRLDKLDAFHLGAFLQLLEFETAFAGEMLGIDAFDQPGVELGKRFTFALMGRGGFDEYQARFREYERLRAGK